MLLIGKTSISMGHSPGKLRSALPLHPHCIFRPHLGAHEVRETFQGSVLLHDLAGIPGAQPRWDGTGNTWNHDKKWPVSHFNILINYI